MQECVERPYLRNMKPKNKRRAEIKNQKDVPKKAYFPKSQAKKKKLSKRLKN